MQADAASQDKNRVLMPLIKTKYLKDFSVFNTIKPQSIIFVY